MVVNPWRAESALHNLVRCSSIGNRAVMVNETNLWFLLGVLRISWSGWNSLRVFATDSPMDGPFL